MSESHSVKNMKGILTDVTLCIGCERCVEACVRVNKLPDELPKPRLQVGDGLSSRRLTTIMHVPGSKYTVRKQCMHCLEPACASACLVGAFKKRADGPVTYAGVKCIGCRYCMIACPFNVPRYEWDKLLPYVRKCKMNEECRVDNGLPACVDACPTQSTIFGAREDLIKEARRRIAESPDKYFDHIFGEHEFGGTSVMFLTPKDKGPEVGRQLGFRSPEELKHLSEANLIEGSIPKMVEPWVKLTPIWAGAIFTGLWGTWLFRRRSLLMNAPSRDHGDAGAVPSPDTAGIDEVVQEKPSRKGKGGGNE